MSNERTPLITSGVCGLAVTSAVCGGGANAASDSSHGTPSKDPRQLNTFFGVMVPTILSMFSIILFLRTGFVVGHAGLLQGLLMLAVAYTIISLTILSICAISTNGAIQGGGAYYMISRSLGPEFGGSIGLMFFLAKVCACGEYVLGLVEAILDVFGSDPESPVSVGVRVLPQGYWYTVLYSSVILVLCLIVCLVGAHIYSRTAFAILLLITVSLLSIFVSSVVVKRQDFVITHQLSGNQTVRYNTSYTGFNATTLRNNLASGYTLDYSTNSVMSFATVFAVLFTSCTGIMAGANMSGDLKTPSISIPKGTIVAVLYTFIIYILLFLLVGATCERTLLTEDYGFLQRINLWPPFVTIGIYCSSLSAAMCAMIGASRILHALALDQLFGLPLAPAAITSRSGNPWVAVLYTWGLAQCVVFAGQLNAIASLVTVFYLLAYAAVDLACLALEWASAPNFRPTFQLFSWHTCLLGILSCLVMMFVINPVYSSGSIVPRGRTPPQISGVAPQVLLMVANPRSSCQLILFVNQLKKGGLFVLGHVQLGDLGNSLQTGCAGHSQLTALNYSYLPIISPCGMKPNMLVLGFYDSCTPEDFFLQDKAFCDAAVGGGTEGEYNFGVDLPSLQAHFPPVRHVESPRWLSPEEYVGMISDAIKMNKNVCLARYFFQLEGEGKNSKVDGSERTIDVWPLNLLQPGSRDYQDVCSLFLLQMACVLNMSNKWRHARMRIFLNVETKSDDQGWVADEETFRELLRKLRIRASIKIVPWDSVVQRRAPPDDESKGALSQHFLSAVNSMLMEHSSPAAVRFLYLPRPPTQQSQSQQYLAQVDAVTNNLGPTLLIHGVTPVTYTDL
uniref:Solute carrier family 12 member 9 n=1 Tax=Takifugu rubripes TaxID=31033 RepID=H2UY54_TAKRU